MAGAADVLITAPTPFSPKCCCPASLLSKEVWPHCSMNCIGLRFQSQSESSSGCVCWPTAASMALHLITLLRPSVQFLAMAHVTSDPPRCQPYWCRPHVVRLSETGHSQWLPHGHGIPYHISFGTRLIFLLSTRTEYVSVPVVVFWCDLTMNCALFTRPLLRGPNAVVPPCARCCKLFLLILYGGLAAAMRQCHLNNIHFYYYYNRYLQGGPQKWHNFLCPLTLSNIYQFSKLFHCQNRRKFAPIPSLKIAPHLKWVAIQPCEISSRANCRGVSLITPLVSGIAG